MTDTDTVTFAPSQWHQDWIVRNWDWPDATPDELRCMWVLEHFLAESNHRFYHLPAPSPLRLGHRGGMIAHIFGVTSFDGAGLAALAVAAFTARVRADVSLGHVYYQHGDDEYVEPRWGDDWQGTERGGTVLALQLNARQADGSLYERHPGVGYLTGMIEEFATA